MKRTFQQGFTLVELLIVIVTIALLATIAYPSYQRYIRKSRLENVRSELLINAKNLERFYAQNRTFEGFSKNNLLQNEYFDIDFFKDTANTAPKNPSASGFLLEAKPNKNSSETCTVFLNSDGIFSVEDSSGRQDCPGYEDSVR